MKTLKSKKTIFILALISALTFLCFFCAKFIVPSGQVYADGEIVFGDVNGDSVLDVSDAIRLQKYLNDDAVEVDLTLCDANADDQVNADDVKRILEVINGYDLPLYKTVYIEATCDADGLSARYSSHDNDQNVYSNVLPKIEHQNGVLCESCGKTYVAMDVTGGSQYASTPTALYFYVDATVSESAGWGVFDNALSCILNETPATLRAQIGGKTNQILVQGFGTATNGTTIKIPMGTTLSLGDKIFVFSHGATITFTTQWNIVAGDHFDSISDNDCVCDSFGCDYTDITYHCDTDGDGNCDGIDCEVAFVEVGITSNTMWAHANDELYFYVDYAFAEVSDQTNFSYVMPILFNDNPVNVSLMKQSDTWLCYRGFGTGAQGSVITIPKGTIFSNNDGVIYKMKETFEFIYDGSNWLLYTNHIDDDFNGKCDGCDMNVVGIAITDNNRYYWPTSELYFHVNTTFDDVSFKSSAPIFINGVPNIAHTISKGDQNNFLAIRAFGTATEGFVVKIPEGYSFVSSDGTIYYLRDGYTFTYDGTRWNYESTYATAFSTEPILVLNEDCDIITRFYNAYQGDVTDLENKATEYFNNAWKDKGISDLILNLENRVPSNNYIGERYLATELNGVAVDFSNNITLKALYEIYGDGSNVEVDPVEIWLEQCKQNDITSWISFRMNDVHWQGNEQSAATGEFFVTAKKNGWLLKDGGRTDYYQYCLDYTRAEVRQYFLDQIEDILNRYDTMGIELDWQREIFCFPTYSIDNCQYMNTFMEELNTIIEAAEVKWGHDIKVMARIMRDVEQNKLFGFDLVNWAQQEEWIDVIVPSSNYGSTDSDMPIAQWIATFEPYGIEIIPGLEVQVDAQTQIITKEVASAYANAYLGAGAEKIYVFNYFYNGNYHNLVSSLGSESAIMGYEKRYVVTSQNPFPWPPQTYQWDPLPMTVNGTSSLGIQVGTLRNSADKIIILGIEDGVDVENLLSVTANGKACTYIGETTNAYINSYNPTYKLHAFRVNGSVDAVNNEIEFAFTANSAVVIQYVEFFNGFFA